MILRGEGGGEAMWWKPGLVMLVWAHDHDLRMRPLANVIFQTQNPGPGMISNSVLFNLERQFDGI